VSHANPPQPLAEFVREWLDALLEHAPAADAATRTEVSQVLTGLTSGLGAVLLAPTLCPTEARELGAGLAGTRLRNADVLPASMRMIRHWVPQVFGLTGTDHALRLVEVLDELAAGYGEALSERSRTEHEELLRAMLDAESHVELGESEARFRTIFTEAAVGIGLARMDGKVLDINPAMLKMFGLTERLPDTGRVTDYVHPDDMPKFGELYGELVGGQRDTIRMEIRFLRMDRTVLWAYLTASLVRTADGSPSHLVAVIEDLTERVRLRTRLEHQTYHDQLTRLPNRSATEERLRWMFSDTSPVSRVGLCALNLDGFRAINDSLGHGVGDRLLLAVASRLQMAASGGHLITRTGGDEFAVLIQDPGHVEELTDLAERVLDSLQRPVVVGAHELTVSACIGIAVADVESSRPAELTRSAEVALSRAKAEGRGRRCLFDPERDAGVAHRFALMARMPSAVSHDEFRLLYQPLVSLADGRLAGVEALVRWQHPQWGMLAPSRFIELAERSGTIVALGRWVLAQACMQGKQWAVEFGDRAPYVSVNVATQQLAEPSLVTDVVQVLRDTGLEPNRLQLEITERAVIDEESGALDALGALKQLGIRLAIDDFGTGYSSLSYLSRFPWDALKIDGSFIEGLRTVETFDPRADKIVEALISMAHALGLEVTAEWVETKAQSERLAALGCETGQGRLFGDAVLAAEVEALLRG